MKTKYIFKFNWFQVYEAFRDIIGQAKKLPKQETKTILEELSNKIEEERAKMVCHHFSSFRQYVILDSTWVVS